MSDDSPCCRGSCNSSVVEQPAASATAFAGSALSTFRVAQMDCVGEERLIRLALTNVDGIISLNFNLPARELQVWHNGPIDPIADKLATLNLGASLLVSAEATPSTSAPSAAADEAGTLKLLLAINALMFVIELVTGWMAQSTGLIADSLDMFADAAVYGLALMAVGHAVTQQVRAARLAGVLQLLLALGALAEVVRRFLFGSEPLSTLMMGIGALALVANVSCLLLLHRHRNGGAHMKASWIFSANDVLANLGVIVAGGLVALTGAAWPDLVIGTIVGLLVLNGARRILALRG